MSDEQKPLRELDSLESKISQVATLCRVLRAENSELRQKLAQVQSEKNSLAGRMDAARDRLTKLAQQLPETRD